jgi:DNA mismatch repair protein MutL
VSGNLTSIKILPENVASKIAAGEVVNRPASVVKELLENSLDANATFIQIIIKNGGKSLIQIVDDGIGMSEDDATLAFQRHATSKISAFEDLESLNSFGFRGEALASVAAVAQVEMRTRTKENDVGILIKIDGNTIVEKNKTACEIGTWLAVRNLFFNTPARKKFLKSDSTEFRHIFNIIQKIALAFPLIKFTFVSDDEEILNLPSQTLPERLNSLFGENVSQNILPVAERNEIISVEGFIGKPTYFRKTQSEQFFFLNKRIIQSKNLNHAVFQGYENMLEKGSFPFYALFISLDMKKVDVNVHPSKMEVKFDDDNAVYRFILSAVRKTLSEGNVVSELPIKNLEGFQNLRGLTPPPQQFHFQSQQKFPAEFLSSYKQENIKNEISSQNVETETSFTKNLEGFENLRGLTFPLQQVHNQYILCASSDGISIIDQHAAHERVLYEKYFRLFETNAPLSQQLLFPLTIELTSADAMLVNEQQINFEKLGFQLKFFGKTTLIVEGIPADVRVGKESNIFREVLDKFKEEIAIKIDAREALIKTFACKAAIKKGDTLNGEEMRSLLEQLLQTQIPHVCPHGRPVTLKLTLTELDRKFGRIS